MSNPYPENEYSGATDANPVTPIAAQKAVPHSKEAYLTEDKWLADVAFNADGLLPAIAQDKDSGDILMMAWMNSEALKQTAKTKTAIYFSRTRGKLWHKGETSGHTQQVHDIYLDCDADAIILKVTQVGGIACHTGRRSCFYRQLELSGSEPKWHTSAPILKDPSDIYGVSPQSIDVMSTSDAASTIDTVSNNGYGADSDSANNSHHNDSHSLRSTTASQSSSSHTSDMQATDVLNQLDAILAERKQASADSSYVASLYAKGINKILEKVGEEAIETVIAAKDLAAFIDPSQMNDLPSEATTVTAALVDDLVYEIADVWFHTVVTLAWFNVKSERVLIELARRFGLSGIDEKNSRTDP